MRHNLDHFDHRQSTVERYDVLKTPRYILGQVRNGVLLFQSPDATCDSTEGRKGSTAGTVVNPDVEYYYLLLIDCSLFVGATLYST